MYKKIYLVTIIDLIEEMRECVFSGLHTLLNAGCFFSFHWAFLTVDSVHKRGISKITKRCYLCEAKEETIDHLLLHRSKTRNQWFSIQHVQS